MTPPSVAALVAPVVVATLAAMAVVGVCTQPTEPDRYEGLVLDGGTVTTTVPLSSAGRPVEPIPHRGLDDIEEDERDRP